MIAKIPQTINDVAAKNLRRGSEGAAEGGCGGNSAAPERRSPAAPPEYLEGGTEQKNILFLFRRKNRARAKSEKRRIFFCEVAAGALAEAGGGAGQSVFRSKKVRAKDIISPQKSESPLAGVFGFSWWDSNPRSSFPDSTLAVCCFRPLSQPSTEHEL